MNIKNYKGLTKKQIKKSREKYGLNIIEKPKKETFITKVIEIFKEPMFFLLIIATSVYFIVGEYIDGIVMLIFVLGICTIEYIQEERTDKALEELNKLSSLNVKVIRNSEKQIINTKQIVVGDIVILEEGDQVPADGKVLYAQSLGINESTLTGESKIVYKTKEDDKKNHFKKNICYCKTNVVNGMGIIEITKIGKQTEVGLIIETLKEIKKEKTPLEKQVKHLVITCTIISTIFLLLTVLLNFLNNSNLELSNRIIKSVLAGITIAMATIPEEIPVVLTVFLAMGAWNLTKENTLTRNLKSIETLGTINVLCTDKTGTITENKMSVQKTYNHSKTLLKTAYYSCPLVAYDPMEKAIKNYCENKIIKTEGKIIKEYAFTPETKMTGQIWEDKTLYVKGAYENILPLCKLDKKELHKIENKIEKYTKEGYRVIALAKQENIKGNPEKITQAKLKFEGLISLYDAPRQGIKESIQKCYQAGVRVIIITGDSGQTAKSIAKQINLKNHEKVLTGIELEQMSDEELTEQVNKVNIYARVYPNHKMRIVKALQNNKKIVAMTGDGVNDASALKKANIGIAMGKRGTNVAKEASDIILLDDNFNTIVKTIENGRNIYSNIKKAISYIIAIHIPIAMLALLVPLFKLPAFILPIHVMLLELLIDPTSSIIFQKIKPTKKLMEQKPRNINEPLLSPRIIITNIMQGILIFITTFTVYMYLIKTNHSINQSISISYSILVISIILIAFQLRNKKLTITNFINSFTDKISIIVNTIVILILLLIIYNPIFNQVANTTPLNLKQWLIIIIISILSVIPFDILKKVDKDIYY